MKLIGRSQCRFGRGRGERARTARAGQLGEYRLWISCRKSHQHDRLDPGCAGEPASQSARIPAWQTGRTLDGGNWQSRLRKFSLSLTYQVGAFQAIATSLGVRPSHVKPHGALYNMAARDPALADAVVARRFWRSIARSFFSRRAEARSHGPAKRSTLRVAREVFADRNYLPDGSLVPRARPDALLHDAEEAAERVLRMLRENGCARGRRQRHRDSSGHDLRPRRYA